MTDTKTWLITGAGRGMGADIARAALAAGHNVVATGRDPEAVRRALGDADRLLIVELDVTSRDDAEAAVRAARDRFGDIDVLVNNAASFFAGFFEELTPEQIERQLATSLIGPMNVTRAALPAMREQRAGHVVTISSSAGLAGFEYCSAYAASKFGVEGWMESLAAEVEPFGIHATIVNPGLLPHGAAHRGVDELRDAVDRGLRRAQRGPARVLEGPERPAGRRPGQARRGAADDRGRGAAAAPLHRRRRRDRHGRAADRRAAGSRSTPSATLHLARLRPRRIGRRLMEHTRLGNTGLKVSRLALGCMSYGDPTTPGAHEWSLARRRRAAVLPAGRRARDHVLGHRERLPGRAPRRRSSAARSSATRGARTSCSPPRSSARCTTARAGRACRARRSSSRSTPRSPGSAPTTSTSTRSTASTPTRPVEETMEALHDVVKAGKVRYLGASSMYALAVRQAPARGRPRRLDAVRLDAEPVQPPAPPGRARADGDVRRHGRRPHPLLPAGQGPARPPVGRAEPALHGRQGRPVLRLPARRAGRQRRPAGRRGPRRDDGPGRAGVGAGQPGRLRPDRRSHQATPPPRGRRGARPELTARRDPKCWKRPTPTTGRPGSDP